MPTYDNLTLYYKETCPYCQKVLRFMETNDITLNMKNTRDAGVSDELVATGGKNQVPFLVMGDEGSMYESDDIIAYLRGLGD